MDTLLQRYSANDQAGVVAMQDPTRITFSASQGPALPIRLCTTWHKVNGEWLLTQSANTVMAQR